MLLKKQTQYCIKKTLANQKWLVRRAEKKLTKGQIYWSQVTLNRATLRVPWQPTYEGQIYWADSGVAARSPSTQLKNINSRGLSGRVEHWSWRSLPLDTASPLALGKTCADCCHSNAHKIHISAHDLPFHIHILADCWISVAEKT